MGCGSAEHGKQDPAIQLQYVMSNKSVPISGPYER